MLDLNTSSNCMECVGLLIKDSQDVMKEVF